MAESNFFSEIFLFPLWGKMAPILATATETGAEPEMVLGVLGPVVEEVLRDLGGLLGRVALPALVAPLHWHILRLAFQDVVDQPVLKSVTCFNQLALVDIGLFLFAQL